LKRLLKTKLPCYNDDDVEKCQYVWQEHELATLDSGCWDSCCCWQGRAWWQEARQHLWHSATVDL